MVNCLLAFNGVIGRPLLKALRVVVFNSLSDNEVSHGNGNWTSAREVIRLKAVLQ